MSALEVPACVVRVTGTLVCDTGAGGTVKVHVDWLGQLVCASTPPKYAWMSPLLLKNPMPVATTLCPACPVDGLSDESTGGPPVEEAGGICEAVRGADGLTPDVLGVDFECRAGDPVAPFEEEEKEDEDVPGLEFPVMFRATTTALSATTAAPTATMANRMAFSLETL